MIHGRSSLIKHILKDALNLGKRLKIILCETRPDCDGYETYKFLKENDIPCLLINDCEVGHQIENVDYVLFAAEAVTKNGGIINRMGTFTIALCAKVMKKPVYVVAENFKFSRLFPLNQSDLPEETKKLMNFNIVPNKGLDEKIDLVEERHFCDFTPSQYITMMISDSGILTPSAISDELIQMFDI